jgi:hypothetical protein
MRSAQTGIAMFDDLLAQLWLLIAGIAIGAIGAFIAGRTSVSIPPEALARYERIAEEEAARYFTRLSDSTQAEVDRLLVARKTAHAIKLIRAELNVGLYDAKVIVDQRKRSVVSSD